MNQKWDMLPAELSDDEQPQQYKARWLQIMQYTEARMLVLRDVLIGNNRITTVAYRIIVELLQVFGSDLLQNIGRNNRRALYNAQLDAAWIPRVLSTIRY